MLKLKEISLIADVMTFSLAEVHYPKFSLTVDVQVAIKLQVPRNSLSTNT